MRKNLVSMLDETGVASRLRVETCDDLFGSAHELATYMSALAYPVFVGGSNYTGAQMMGHPVLVALIRQFLAGQVKQARNALVVPLGVAAGEALQRLIAEGVIEADRCLLGFPHPSGANGHRKRQFEARRTQLTAGVTRWGS